jgi:hypothetical protein
VGRKEGRNSVLSVLHDCASDAWEVFSWEGRKEGIPYCPYCMTVSCRGFSLLLANNESKIDPFFSEQWCSCFFVSYIFVYIVFSSSAL